jgi:Rha family phage regulatory protein
MTSILPTKAGLLKTSIVAIDQHHKKVITSTVQIADHFGKRHSNVIRRLTALIEIGLLKIEPSYYLNLQAKKQKYYELNRDQFLLMVMGFTGKKSEQFKADFIKLFNQQEAELKQWRAGRLVATDTTKQANDHIHWLQKELTKVIPSSRCCTMLFIHIQQAITKAATGSAKTKREMMTACQLFQVGELEHLVEISIERFRREGIAAEKIRKDVIALIKTQSKSFETKAMGFQMSRTGHDARFNKSLATELINGV